LKYKNQLDSLVDFVEALIFHDFPLHAGFICFFSAALLPLTEVFTTLCNLQIASA
jgi:hypothetical protein